ncbi:ribonuclease III [Candidatus Dojkabacteria bacterium HGW-Dojkabacteria-1]|uniref:Ribonuclease 3 n=1 Tax=Candidatus Dojkabacteria bacterium HGW-Dojkabacteria-1 TaxID=2013761 RepID=A0A2N2F488_9BACT|nr:MAG: ribonuclease III [Candidatus Dojkabacteria bacterium HGW-Dojkabacteria-1]
MINQINSLEQNIEIEFTDKVLLETSVTHRSYLNEHREIPEHNERLEFLGDAVLELIVSDYLYKEFLDRAEGELTSFRSALVRTDSLAESAKNLRIGEFLRLSRGEEDSGGREKDYLLANAFEAVLGAIYLDKGYEEAKNFVYRTLIPKLGEIVEYRLDIDNKTKIQELAQSEYKTTPTYEVINEQGPDHDKTFTVVVKIDDKIIGEGTGSSKQKAEERAAEVGIEYIESKK